MGVFPGSKMNFSSWIMSLFANVMVFPISLGFIILIHLFISQDKGGLNLWAPPGLFGLSNGLINLLVGFVGMTILPVFPTLIPQMITQAKPSPFGQALGKQMSNIPVVSWAGRTAMSTANSAFSMSAGRQIDKIWQRTPKGGQSGANNLGQQNNNTVDNQNKVKTVKNDASE